MSDDFEFDSAQFWEQIREPWVLTVIPEAREASGAFVSTRPRHPSLGFRKAAARRERARIESGRRARARLRVFCAANRLNRLGTLTYRGHGCHDPVQARADVGAFWRALRLRLGGERFPYAWVTEWHSGGHGLH